MKNVSVFIALLLMVVSCSRAGDEFRSPSREYRPHVRMWIPQAAVQEEELRSQIRDLSKAGFGDVEIVAFDVERRGFGPNASASAPKVSTEEYGWGTSAWTNTMCVVLDEAGKNDMKATFTIGPAWPVASPLLKSDSPGVEIQLGCTRIDSVGQSYTGDMPSDAFAVVEGRLIPGTSDFEFSSLKDVTSEVVSDGKIVWKAPSKGKWSLLIYRNERVGEMKSGFYVIDHLGMEGVQSVIDYYKGVFAELEKAGLLKYLNGLFGDSLEYRASVDWTPSFTEVFRELKGYDITPYLPAIHNGVSLGGGGIFGGGFGKDSLEGKGKSILNDYYSVVTYLFNENHLKPLQAFLEGYGMNLRYQTAYGKTMEQSSTSMNVGIPEGEMMMIRNSFDNIRAQSGAVHVAGRREYNAELQAESGKNHAQSWQNVLFFAQRAFAAGVNNITLHGYNYSGRFSGEGSEGGFVPDVSWPGWEGFGRDGFSNSWGAEPLWTMADSYTGFLARNGYILKKGTPKVDVAIYRESYWDNASFTDNKDGSYWYKDGSLLQDLGWTYDFVGLPQLNLAAAKIENGRMFPDGPSYKAIILDQSLDTRNEPFTSGKMLSEAAAEKILEFAQQGLPVLVIGDVPVCSSHYAETLDGDSIPGTMEKLLALPNVKSASDFAAVPSVLTSLGVTPDMSFSQERNPNKLIGLHREDEGTSYFYIYNRGTNGNSGNTYGWGYGNDKELPYGMTTAEVTFRCEGTPYILDAWTGNIIKAPESSNSEGVVVPVTLKGNESVIIAVDRSGSLSKAAIEVPVTQVVDHVDLQSWDLVVSSWNEGDDASSVKTTDIAVSMDKLLSWNKVPELKGVSGIGTYSTKVNMNKHKSVILDLGTINYSYRLKINGKTVPSSQTNTCVEIAPFVKNGENQIEIVVATTLNNKIKAMSTNSRRTEDPYGLLGKDGVVSVIFSD